MPVTVRQRPTADKSEQTKPEDPKFVARLKTLHLGVSRKCHSSKGLSLLQFLPHDAHSAKHGNAIVSCPSVRNIEVP